MCEVVYNVMHINIHVKPIVSNIHDHTRIRCWLGKIEANSILNIPYQGNVLTNFTSAQGNECY